MGKRRFFNEEFKKDVGLWTSVFTAFLWAGMGGGSSDAAAALVGLNRLWGLGLGEDELEKIGLTIGADVPFCIRGGLQRARGIGEKLTRQACGVQPRWDACDLTGSAALPQAELVCEGYMLGELEAGMRLSVAERLWNACGQMLVLIEPGTPQGFANLRAVRERLTALGAYVAAPCPQGSVDCPMTGENWCHFAVRVQRTRLHKALKGGDAPFEDEKFSYLVLTRQEPKHACRMRVLRHAQIAPGRITVPVCGEAGEKLLTVTKKDPLWKRVRKIKWGEKL